MTVGKGYADETEARGRRHARARRAVGIAPGASRRDRRDGDLRRPDRGHVARAMREVYGVTADSELALKATSAADRPVLERKVERILRKRLPEPRRALERGAQGERRGPGEPAVRDLLRDRRRRDLRQPVRDRQHADDVGARAHPRDRRAARARLDPLAGAPPGRRREPRDRPDRRPPRDRRRRRASAAPCSRASPPGSRVSSTARRSRRWPAVARRRASCSA